MRLAGVVVGDGEDDGEGEVVEVGSGSDGARRGRKWSVMRVYSGVLGSQ